MSQKQGGFCPFPIRRLIPLCRPEAADWVHFTAIDRSHTPDLPLPVTAGSVHGRGQVVDVITTERIESKRHGLWTTLDARVFRDLIRCRAGHARRSALRHSDVPFLPPAVPQTPIVRVA